MLIPLLFTVTVTSHEQNDRLPLAPTTGLVQRALAAELEAAKDPSHPMRYLLTKTSPRVTTTREIIETRDGAVARLVSVNDQPPSPADVKKDETRLDSLLSDPGKQHHRKQAEEEDMARALKVLRALPSAFKYRYVGMVAHGPGSVARFVFTPNPNYEPQDLETQILTAMNGEIWIDPTEGRAVHLEGRLQQDVDFGWGVLGRLYKGGWITIDQADVGGGQWRVVKLQMSMSARVLIRTHSFQTFEVESHFVPVPANLDYQQAIAMLRAGREPEAGAGR
jgi:hypothetical protein